MTSRQVVVVQQQPQQPQQNLMADNVKTRRRRIRRHDTTASSNNNVPFCRSWWISAATAKITLMLSTMTTVMILMMTMMIDDKSMIVNAFTTAPHHHHHHQQSYSCDRCCYRRSHQPNGVGVVLEMSKQKKKPRFSQQVHVDNSSSSSNNNMNGGTSSAGSSSRQRRSSTATTPTGRSTATTQRTGRMTTDRSTDHGMFYPRDDEYDRNDYGYNNNGYNNGYKGRRRSGGPGAGADTNMNGRKQQRNSSYNSNNNNNQVWNSGKSIEELEGIMTHRWGTMMPTVGGSSVSSSSVSSKSNTKTKKTPTNSKRTNSNVFAEFEMDFRNDGDEYVYEDDDDDDELTSVDGNDDVSPWRRPVIDPWEQEEVRKRNQERRFKDASTDGETRKSRRNHEHSYKAQTPLVREFYDEDDEGYESDTLSTSSSSSVLRVDHLIAPQPASTSSSTNRREGSYFFNPDAATRSPSASSSKDRDGRKPKENSSSSSSNDESSSSSSSSRSSRSSSASQPAKPLLDENGQPILLTVEEAFRRFQQTVDEGTMERIEAADFPLLATSSMTTTNGSYNDDKEDGDDDNDGVADNMFGEAASHQAPSWSNLGITSPILLENLEYMNCPTPLSVQEKTTPAILTGSDVLVGTYTGSGKTLSFLVPLIQSLLWNMENEFNNNGNSVGISVLIVAPGRELASQIVSVARELLQDTGLTAQLAIGGTTFSRNLEQIRKRKPNILVGTPGRIAELIVGKPGEKGGRLKVASLQALVMDEFDALLEYKPHRDPTQAIMQALKRRHGNSLQSILCSATATDIMESTKVTEFLRPNFEIAMADEEDVLVTAAKGKRTKGSAQVSRTVLHGVVHLPHRRFALDTVRRILHTDPMPQQILIFVENARKVDIVVDKLADRGIIAAPLHGGTPGSDSNTNKMDRAQVSKALREGYVGIVVCTELAARGLDAPLLTHVINLDLPTDASHYAHRAGRCGRGGRPGVVINFTTSPQERNVPQRFADSLGIQMHPVEARSGKLLMLDPATVVE